MTGPISTTMSDVVVVTTLFGPYPAFVISTEIVDSLSSEISTGSTAIMPSMTSPSFSESSTTSNNTTISSSNSTMTVPPSPVPNTTSLPSLPQNNTTNGAYPDSSPNSGPTSALTGTGTTLTSPLSSGLVSPVAAQHQTGATAHVNAGAVAGGIIAALTGIFIITCGFLLLRRRRQRAQARTQAQEIEPSLVPDALTTCSTFLLDRHLT